MTTEDPHRTPKPPQQKPRPPARPRGRGVVGGVPKGSSGGHSGAFKMSEIDALVAKNKALRAERKKKRATQKLPKFVRRQKSVARAPTFLELGWNAGDNEEKTQVLAMDLGTQMICTSKLEGSHHKVSNSVQPTALIVEDAHAFRSLEPFSLEFGSKAFAAWPADRVLRGTQGRLLIDSQIGLVNFPVDHALAAIVAKARHSHSMTERQLVLSLPTFLPKLRRQAIRDKVASYRRGSYLGAPGALAAAYFYLIPGLIEDSPGDMAQWARSVLRDDYLLVIDWGASGLEYGLVALQKKDPKLALSLVQAGTWPSLGGDRLTMSIVESLKELVVEACLSAGPSEALTRRALFKPKAGGVPRPVGYEDAFQRLLHWGPILNKDEAKQVRQLKNLIFPTAWLFDKGMEPEGYAPYRRLAILHFKALWLAAERIKRLLLSKPAYHRSRGSIPWHIHDIDSPFLQSIEASTIEFPVDEILDKIQRELGDFLMHLDKRLRAKNVRGLVNMAFSGMQAGSDLLRGVSEGLSARLAPYSKRPDELKSVVNRGAALLQRDWTKLELSSNREILPFSIHMADCLGNIPIFEAGPIDELQVYQRRIRVEDGFPNFEFFLYESLDGSQQGSWGCIDFSKPVQFSAQDRSFGVDPKYGFGKELPLFRDMRGDDGRGLMRCFDRGMGWTDGRISFRDYADKNHGPSQNLIRFLEHDLRARFHSKVFLLEREFKPPQQRFDYMYQRYYLSYSQELMVVREWWAPGPDKRLLRRKHLYTCQGSKEANAILGVKWGYV